MWGAPSNDVSPDEAARAYAATTGWQNKTALSVVVKWLVNDSDPRSAMTKQVLVHRFSCREDKGEHWQDFPDAFHSTDAAIQYVKKNPNPASLRRLVAVQDATVAKVRKVRVDTELQHTATAVRTFTCRFWDVDWTPDIEAETPAEAAIQYAKVRTSAVAVVVEVGGHGSFLLHKNEPGYFVYSTKRDG